MHTKDLDSTDRLARAISRRLGEHMPTDFSVTAAMPAVAGALHATGLRNESRIAVVRVVLVLGYLVAALLARVGSSGTGASGAAGLGGVLLALGWAAGAVALALALRRGWYPSWLRRAIPVSDAVLLASAFLLTRWHAGADWVAVAPGALAVVTPLCAALAFSGALRLTTPAATLSGVSALAVLLIVAGAARLPAVYVVGTLAALGVAVAAAREMASVVRQVLAHEVGRAEMDRLYALAREAVTAREETVKIVAHDLRNPLHTVTLATSLLLEAPAMPDALRVKQLTSIQRAAARMQRLIRDLLDVARMEAGTLAVELAPVAPRALLADALDAMGAPAAAGGLSLVVVDADAIDALPLVRADAERIAQVFSNLIGNAIKFTPPGGRITLGATAADGKVWFTVTDTGPGIPADALPNVFGRFWQASRRDGRGIGLGLAIAQGIVEAHEGTIGVDSEVGVGATFWFGVGMSLTAKGAH